MSTRSQRVCLFILEFLFKNTTKITKFTKTHTKTLTWKAHIQNINKTSSERLGSLYKTKVGLYFRENQFLTTYKSQENSFLMNRKLVIIFSFNCHLFID